MNKMKKFKHAALGLLVIPMMMFGTLPSYHTDASGSKNGDVPVVSGYAITAPAGYTGPHTPVLNVAGDPSQWGF